MFKHNMSKMKKIILLLTILTLSSSLETKFIQKTDFFYKDNNNLYTSVYFRLK